jgi:sugar lactone lactonase YvrE
MERLKNILILFANCFMDKRVLGFLMLAFVSLQANGQIITTIAGDGSKGLSGDGEIASYSRLNMPTGIAIDDSNCIYITDRDNNKIRKINIYGYMTTFAGTGIPGKSGDNGPAIAAKMNFPEGIVVDKKHNVYFADAGNNCIRKISAAGIITTIAGTGQAGFGGDSGLATNAKLNHPSGIALDDTGNLYIADCDNSRIRKVDTFGKIYTIAGIGEKSYKGDSGLAIYATLNRPKGIAYDGKQGIVFCDVFNNSVRRIDLKTGIITTIAGDNKGLPGYGGDNMPAVNSQLKTPIAITADKKGNLFISDQGNHRIRQIDVNGMMSTIAGTGQPGPVGSVNDGGSADAALLFYPIGIAIDSANNVYFTEQRHTVRFVYTGPLNVDPISIYPNPCESQCIVRLASTYEEEATLQVINAMGQITSTVVAPTNRTITIKFEAVGMYFLRATSKHKTWGGRVVTLIHN